MFLFALLPASLPRLVSGMKQARVFAWRSLISGEMIFVSLGLGHLLIMAIGYLVDRLLFRAIERGIRRKWGLAAAP